MSRYRIGISVGGTNVKIGLFNGDLNLTDTMQVLVDQEAEPDRIVSLLEQIIHRILENNGLGLNVLDGVGAAFPSYIDYANGYIVETANFPLLNGVPIRDMLQNRLGVPVYVDNDANVAALAEHELGAGRGHDNMIYAALATGIGGGLIINGKLFRGMHGMAGEIGHMIVSDTMTLPCSCGGSGCVHSIAGGGQMARYVVDRIKEGRDSTILDYAGTLSGVDMIAVGKAMRTGDSLALEVVSRGAEYLGRMFHNLNQIFDINYFVYGGGVTKLGSRFIDRMIAAYRHYSLNDRLYPASFVPAQLGDQAGIHGAALLIPRGE